MVRGTLPQVSKHLRGNPPLVAILDPEAFSIVGLRVQNISTGKASELLLLEVIVMSPGIFCASFRKRPAEIARSRDIGLTGQTFRVSIRFDLLQYNLESFRLHP